MASVRSFHKYRGESSFTLLRLIEVLKEQIPQISARQTKYRVTEIPSERTIRFYTSNGLVDKPIGHDGGRGLYGYRHLLQILAIKYLQSQYLPLVKVRALLDGADNRHLEQMIPQYASGADNRRLSWEVVSGVASTAKAATPIPPEADGAAVASAETADTRSGHEADAWHRVEVAPGIEINVHAAALTAEGRERLRGALLREIAVMRGWSAG